MCLYRGENYSKKVGKLTKVIILVLWLYRGWLYGGLTVFKFLNIFEILYLFLDILVYLNNCDN